MNYETLKRFFNNECSDHEAHQVLLWLNNEQSAKDLANWFDLFDEDDESLNLENGMRILEKTKYRIAQQKLIEEVKTKPSKMIASKNTRRTLTVRRIAASIAFILSATASIYFLLNRSDSYGFDVKSDWVLEVADAGQRRNVVLPDGSTVMLNSKTKLFYPPNFDNSQRNVVLKGEAFFDVKRDESRPFRIQSGDLDVHVLGTSFVVKSYAEDENIRVAVKSGKVGVSKSGQEERHLLLKSDLIDFNKNEKLFSQQRIENEASVFGWMEEKLVFDDQSLEDIINVMSRWYGVKFEVNENLELSKKFTAVYKKPRLQTVLESLSIAYDFKYEINEKHIVIK